jgi:two-component system, chemotaxis family, sensor kinase CheA
MSTFTANEKLQGILNDISSRLIDTDAVDMPTMVHLHNQLEAIEGLDGLPQQLLDITDPCKKCVENMILEDTTIEDGAKQLGDNMTTLQELALDLERGVLTDAGSDSEAKASTANVDVSPGLRAAREVIRQLEKLALEMETQDKPDIAPVQTFMKTLRDLAGFDSLVSSIDDISTTLEQQKANDIAFQPESLLAFRDLFSDYCDRLEAKGAAKPDPARVRGVLTSLETTASAEETAEDTESTPPAQQDTAVEEPEDDDYDVGEFPPEISDPALAADFVTEASEHIQSAESALVDLEMDPHNTDQLDVVFRAFHTIKGVAGFLNLTLIQDVAHKTETFLDMARKGDIELSGVYIDLALDALDLMRELIEQIGPILEGEEVELPGNIGALIRRLDNPTHQPDTSDEQRPGQKIGNILVEEGAASEESVIRARVQQEQGDHRPLGKILVEDGHAKAKKVASALRKQKTPGAKGGKSGAHVESTIRVSTTRLDNLIDMIGELVIAHAMVDLATEKKSENANDDPVFQKNMNHLGKIVRELQGSSMSLRMVTLKSTFQKMSRLVRDLSRKAQKDIIFEFSGEETELDRNVVDAIGDPLVHMIRNSVDHGVEESADRQAAGKDNAGHVQLRAFHQGGSVVIELEDDGRGLNREKIIAKAEKLGTLPSGGQGLSDKEIFQLIFAAGLSTKDKVTDISGRGVGMDVVKKTIEGLRGMVSIDSAQGKGSTFTIRLPLTLAIIDGMILGIGDDKFILPTLSIIENYRPTPSQITTVPRLGEVVNMRGELVQLVRLSRLLSIPNAIDDPCEGLVVIVSVNSKNYAFQVDELLGQQQVVIKNLGDGLDQLPGVSGGAIMGDGQVSLILDPAGIVRHADSTL